MAHRILPNILIKSVKSRYFHSSNRHDKLVQFILSDIGEGIREVTVRDWFVKVGDKVSQFDDICMVESDKASVNITSRYDGVVQKLHHEVGDVALVGKALVDIDVPEEEPEKDSKKLKDEPKVQIDEPNAQIPEPTLTPKEERVKSLATPAVRRLASEHNISLDKINGTGKSGRVMKEDILAYINESKPQTKQEQISTEDKVIVISGIKKAMVKSMTLSNAIPSFGYCDEINVTKLVALRENIKDFVKKQGVNVTYMPFFIKALSKSLEKFPELNAIVDENCEKVTIKGSHNIGVAVDTPDGLIVPNIKRVQDLSILEISKELHKLAVNAKERKLTVKDLTGGTFTISNIGIIGGTYVRPLINPPEVGIVGIGKFQNSPVYIDDQLVKATVCNVSWTADHRVIDGATMARFANVWRDYIENPSHLMLNI